RRPHGGWQAGRRCRADRRDPAARAGAVHAVRVALRGDGSVARRRSRRGSGARTSQPAAAPPGDHSVIGVTIGTQHYFVLGALLFTIGSAGLLLRRNTIVMFMCVELMLNAVNLTFVAFARDLDDAAGQASVFFTLIVAAAEVAVGLAIIVAIF